MLLFRMDSGENRTVALLQMCGKESKSFAYLDGVTLGLMEVTASTVRMTPFLRRELDKIGIAVEIPPKIVALLSGGTLQPFGSWLVL